MVIFCDAHLHGSRRRKAQLIANHCGYWWWLGHFTFMGYLQLLCKLYENGYEIAGLHIDRAYLKSLDGIFQISPTVSEKVPAFLRFYFPLLSALLPDTFLRVDRIAVAQSSYYKSQ